MVRGNRRERAAVLSPEKRLEVIAVIGAGTDGREIALTALRGGYRTILEDVSAEVIELLKRQAKNICCLLMLANGIPMLTAGDEFLHTQGGNNNPYNQDNETTCAQNSTVARGPK